MLAKIKGILGQVSLEPCLLFVALGRFILEGAQIQADLLIWKICKLEFNFTDEICDNLTLDKYDEYNNIVQTRANNFLLIQEWLQSGPAFVISFFAGSLLDNHGAKIFVLTPLIGMLLSDIGILVNYIFIESLPIEFFYIEPIWAFFGGKSVYYLGVYAYGTAITTPANRASRLALFDGFEQSGKIIGTILSPIIVNNVGK